MGVHTLEDSPEPEKDPLSLPAVKEKLKPRNRKARGQNTRQASREINLVDAPLSTQK
jgi:hypothetical protein